MSALLRGENSYRKIVTGRWEQPDFPPLYAVYLSTNLNVKELHA
jgi:hypothetical protein